MARSLGGIVGLAFALVLSLITASVLGTGSFSEVITVGLGAGAWIAVAVSAVAMATVSAYTVAAIALRPHLAEPAVAAALPSSVAEQAIRGLLIGIAAGVNFGLWMMVPFAWPIGVAVGLICCLSVFPPLSGNVRFQRILGWTNWIMPYSWLAGSVGLLLFLVNLPFAMRACGRRATRFDGLTATFETTGGLVSVTGFVGGFNLGNFTFLIPEPGEGLASTQTPFGSPGLSAHETGHTLTLAAFGGMFHWINAIHENVPPLRRNGHAYGELIAESHFARSLPFRNVAIWS